MGGPTIKVMGGDVHTKTSTRNGRFVVAIIAPHISYGKYAFYSGIACGTPLREYNKKPQVKKNGVWVNLSSIAGFDKYADKDILDVLKKSYAALSHKTDLTTLPDSWMYNDFGHIKYKVF